MTSKFRLARALAAASTFALGAAAARAQELPLVEIAAVQGAGHRSPLESQLARVAGVVTAVDPKPDAKSGERTFWLQQPAPSDRNPATSEGVMVKAPASLWEGSGTPLAGTPAVGQSLEVVGKVVELEGGPNDLSVTTIQAQSLQVLGKSALPPTVVLGRQERQPPGVLVDDDGLKNFQAGGARGESVDAIDFYESLEGMLVTVPEPVVTGATTARGELVVLGDGGRLAGPRSRRGAVLLRAGDDNPDRLTISGRVLTGGARLPELMVGARLDGPVTGVLDYAFGSFRILAGETFEGLPPAMQPDTVGPPASDAVLGIATFNVENLSAAESKKRFDQVGWVIAQGLGAPDIVALQEIQDDSGSADDGVVAAEETLKQLISAITRVGGPAYEFRQADPENNRNGGQPGGNIRPAFLFRPDRVQFLDLTGDTAQPLALLRGQAFFDRSPARIDHPSFSADPAQGWDDSRKPLYGHFRFRGRDLLLIATHLRSKRGDTPLFGKIQPPFRGSEAQRNAQAVAVAGLASELLDADPRAAVVVLGDMNEHEFRQPMRILASRLHDLIEDLPLADRYTYNFQGNAQVLDHILVSPGLLELGPTLDAVHLSSDFPENHQASDHDPLLVRIAFP